MRKAIHGALSALVVFTGCASNHNGGQTTSAGAVEGFAARGGGAQLEFPAPDKHFTFVAKDNGQNGMAYYVRDEVSGSAQWIDSDPSLKIRDAYWHKTLRSVIYTKPIAMSFMSALVFEDRGKWKRVGFNMHESPEVSDLLRVQKVESTPTAFRFYLLGYSARAWDEEYVMDVDARSGKTLLISKRSVDVSQQREQKPEKKAGK